MFFGIIITFANLHQNNCIYFTQQLVCFQVCEIMVSHCRVPCYPASSLTYHIFLLLFYIFISLILVSSPPLLVTRTVKISNTFFTTTPQVDNSTINVTWYPPNTPNGAIMRYSINVTSTGRNTIMRHINNAGNISFTELIRDLSKFMYL